LKTGTMIENCIVLLHSRTDFFSHEFSRQRILLEQNGCLARLLDEYSLPKSKTEEFI